MLTTGETFRYVKPVASFRSATAVGITVSYTDYPFTDSYVVSPMNRCTFDVIDSLGRTLPREEGKKPFYWFENGSLVCREPGEYTLRVFDNVNNFDNVIIKVNKGLFKAEEENLFDCSVPFWPQIMFQGAFGVARVSNDGRQLSFAAQGNKGAVSVGYRLINAYGQVSEPACVNITVI